MQDDDEEPTLTLIVLSCSALNARANVYLPDCRKKSPPAHQVSALRCAQREYRLASRICALFLKMCCLLKLRRGYLRVSVLAVCQETTCEARGRSAVSRAVNDDQPSVRSHPCRIAFARTTDGFQVNIALLNASS